MADYKQFIEENVEIFPNEFKFGSFIRYEHCHEACEMAVESKLLAFLRYLDEKDKAAWVMHEGIVKQFLANNK